MKVDLIDLEKVIPYARNPRITVHAVDKVAASIKEFGFRQPIVVDSEMVIIAGHVRYLASQKLGLKKVPVHIAESLTAAQVQAYRIADNRTGEEAQWDKELLAIELGELESLEFDNSILGFELSELEELKRGLDSLEDGVDDGGEKPIDEADTKATIGPYRSVNFEEMLSSLKKEKQVIEKKVEQFLDRIVSADSAVLITAYERQIKQLEEQKLLVEEKIQKYSKVGKNPDEINRTALDFIQNPYKYWACGGLSGKRTVLNATFSRPLVYSKNEGYRTAALSLPFRIIRDLSEHSSELVPPVGLEPTRP